MPWSFDFTRVRFPVRVLFDAVGMLGDLWRPMQLRRWGGQGHLSFVILPFRSSILSTLTDDYHRPTAPVSFGSLSFFSRLLGSGFDCTVRLARYALVYVISATLTVKQLRMKRFQNNKALALDLELRGV